MSKYALAFASMVGAGVSALPVTQARIPRPELSPRYILEDLTGKPLVTDGVADPKEWPTTRKAQLECTNKIDGPQSKLACKVRAGFDGERIRLLMTVAVDAAKPLKTDGKWRERDGFELAFSDTGEDAPVFMLHGYPDGTFEVTSPAASAAVRSTAIQAAVSYGAKAGAGSWTAELALPVAFLGIKPAAFRQLRFNMNVRRTCDDTWTCWWTPENGMADLLSAGLLILPRQLPETTEMARRREAVKPLVAAETNGDFSWRLLKGWPLSADPDRLGPNALPADAPRMSFSNGSGWAVARHAFPLTAAQLASPFCALFVPCIDEEGEVYLNGRLVASRTAKVTGIAPGLLWRQSFLVDLKPLGLKPGEVAAAIHLRGNMGTGGLRKGVFLVWGKAPATAEQIYDLMVGNPKLGRRDRVPASWRDMARQRIPSLPPVADEVTFGRRIQRTMNLLATSTPEKRNRVRILFYGQSITQGMHSREMINVLRSRFPWAIIDFENRAIGGFGASSLVRVGEHDLYPRDADLLIFHVYGDAKSLDTIFGNVRRRNSSEILVYTHHYNWVNDPEKLKAKVDYLARDTVGWHKLAEKYQMELAPVNRDWPLFFRAHDWGLNEVMGDTVHSNVHHNTAGHALLASLVLRNFRHHPDGPVPFPDAVKRVAAAKVASKGAWQREGEGVRTTAKGASLKLSFVGNRVDLLPLPTQTPGTARILIDGRSPREFRELYYCTRPSEGPYIWMPAIKRIGFGEKAIPQVESWTLTPLNVDLKRKTLSYRLAGSVTGADGEGSKAADFMSSSGRIKLSKRDFHIIWPCTYRKKDKLPDGYTVTWDVRALFVDPWRPAAHADPAYEVPVTLVQGLSNGPHTLEIIANGDGEIPIKALLVRQPPLK